MPHTASHLVAIGGGLWVLPIESAKQGTSAPRRFYATKLQNFFLPMPETTWKALSETLGIAQNTLRAWRRNPTSPKSKDAAEWRFWRDNRLPTQGRETKLEAANIADLKKALLLEQGRKERAIASLRELELKRESESLVPQSEVTETILKTLTPLRRLLDALPRLVAASANPENPMIAELAIRNGLDERVFAEIQKILLEQD